MIRGTMNFEPFYRVECPECKHTVKVLETTLRRIAQGIRVSRRANDPIAFLCQQCKRGFLYDWANKRASGAIEVPLQRPDLAHQKLAYAIAECDDKNCNCYVELIAIRSASITDEDFVAEWPEWNVDNLRCSRKHRLLRPPQARTSRIPPS
jgi:hypothetical protein